MKILCFFWISAFLLSSSSQSYSFPWLALCDTSPLSMATFGHLSGKWSKCHVTARLIVWRHHPCQWFHPILSVKMVNAPCHGTAIHLSVLDHVGIESSDSFACVTNAPQSQVWSSSQSFNPWILLRIPQTMFRPSGFSWMPPSILAYTTKILIKEAKRCSFILI